MLSFLSKCPSIAFYHTQQPAISMPICILNYARVNKKARLWGSDLSGSMQGAGGVGGMLSESSPITSNPITFNSSYPTYDGNGNVSEYLDSTGQVTAHYEYDPFGNTVVNTDTSNQFAYRFSTKPLAFATGLYYYGYRYYDPMTGRWPSRDPIEERGGINLYGFVVNDGVNRLDMLGLTCKQDCKDTAGRKIISTTAMAIVMATGCSVLPPPASFVCYAGVITWQVAELSQIKADRDKCIKTCPCEPQSLG
jgi:RHS repeat-associated protein